jgi:hypothetical protein
MDPAKGSGDPPEKAWLKTLDPEVQGLFTVLVGGIWVMDQDVVHGPDVGREVGSPSPGVVVQSFETVPNSVGSHRDA